MTDIISAPAPRPFWRNYLAHTIEGGLYMGGMAFVETTTVLTFLVKSLNGPALLVGLIPILLPFGFMAPSLFVAHRMARLNRLKPFVMMTGIFQRLPYLAAALALLYMAGRFPLLTVLIAALTPLISGLAGGFSHTAWMGLVAKTIPANRLCSTWAGRLIIQNVIGLCAGMIIYSVLAARPGPAGYGILHLIVFGFLVISYLVFAMIRETDSEPIPADNTGPGLAASLKAVPGLMRADRRLSFYILSRFFNNMLFLMTPFLSTHVLGVLNRPATYLGYLVGFTSAGSIAGNFIAGYCGDRWGARPLLVIGRIVSIAVAILALGAGGLGAFCAMYALLGCGQAFTLIGDPTFRIAISPPERRHIYLALMAFLALPPMLIASVLSAWLWERTGSVHTGAAAAAVCAVLSLGFLLKIPGGDAIGTTADAGR